MERADETSLSHADPTRLALLLNFSVFLHENLSNKEQALEMASKTHENALIELGSLDKSKSSEASTVLEFIRENIKLWKSGSGQAKAGSALPLEGGHKKNMFS